MSAPAFSMSSIRPANASARAASYTVSATGPPRLGTLSLPPRAHVRALRPGEPRRGEVLQRVRRRRSASQGAAGEERRVVSVLFVDLVGFTSRSEKLDPEDVRAFLVPYYERVRGELESHGGKVEKFVGDAVMGVFGAPVTYGDDAERAVRAAFAVRDWAEDEGLQLRVAVNTGEAIVALDASPERGETFVAGDVVNTAARLQSASPVGAVLVGEETYIGTRGSIEYRPAQPVVAKGKEAPVQAWLALRATSAIGERPAAPVPMVGRDRELGSSHRRLGTRRRRGTELTSSRSSARPGSASRESRSSSHSSSQHRARVSSAAARPRTARRSPYSAFGQQVKQIARDLRQRRRRRGNGEARRCGRRARRAGGRRGARAESRDAPRPRRRPRGRRPRAALLLGPRPRRVARAARVRHCSCTRTSTGRTRACSTCSRRSRPACATCRCCSSRSPVPSFSANGRAGAAACPRTRRFRWSRSADAASRELADELLGRVDARDDARRAGRGDGRGQPAVHRGARQVPRRAAGRGARRAAHEHPRDHRGEARRASGRRSAASWSTRPWWAGCSGAARCSRSTTARTCRGARLTRGARPDPARGGVPDPGRPAVRASSTGSSTTSRTGRFRARRAAASTPRSRGSSRRRPPSVSRTRRSATTGARPARTSARSSTSRPPPTRRVGAGRRSDAVALYREALEVVAEDDARRRDVTRKLAVALQAAYHLGDVGGVPAGEPG